MGRIDGSGGALAGGCAGAALDGGAGEALGGGAGEAPGGDPALDWAVVRVRLWAATRPSTSAGFAWSSAAVKAHTAVTSHG
jgi:hypothetical protein